MALTATDAAAVARPLRLTPAVRQPHERRTAPFRPPPAVEAHRPPRRAPAPREGTKQAQLIAMLRRKEGATIAQIVDATGWQPHTVRGALVGALKKRLGLSETPDKIKGKDRVYQVA
jgi:hypothetical protein